MHQSELLKKLERIFFKDIEKLTSREIPLGTNQRIIQPKNDVTLISKIDQTKYRSGIRMLLYLVKYSRPNLSNAIHELSKVNDRATKDYVDSLLRVIKFAVDTKNKLLVYILRGESKQIWELRAYSDSDWAGDANDRRSITGFCIFLNGCLIPWKLRRQKTVTLLLSEAEYVAVAEVCAAILFIKTILDFLQLKIDLPITVMCDNVGAIFFVRNSKNSGRTKHINIKYHFIREYIIDGTVQVQFVRSGNNFADPLTKNMSKESYVKNSSEKLEDINNL